MNKAQGQTLDFIGVYLPEDVFSHGQLYVALSRVHNSTCVAVLTNNMDGYTKYCLQRGSVIGRTIVVMYSNNNHWVHATLCSKVFGGPPTKQVLLLVLKLTFVLLP